MVQRFQSYVILYTEPMAQPLEATQNDLESNLDQVDTAPQGVDQLIDKLQATIRRIRVLASRGDQRAEEIQESLANLSDNPERMLRELAIQSETITANTQDEPESDSPQSPLPAPESTLTNNTLGIEKAGLVKPYYDSPQLAWDIGIMMGRGIDGAQFDPTLIEATDVSERYISQVIHDLLIPCVVRMYPTMEQRLDQIPRIEKFNSALQKKWDSQALPDDELEAIKIAVIGSLAEYAVLEHQYEFQGQMPEFTGFSEKKYRFLPLTLADAVTELLNQRVSKVDVNSVLAVLKKYLVDANGHGERIDNERTSAESATALLAVKIDAGLELSFDDILMAHAELEKGHAQAGSLYLEVLSQSPTPRDQVEPQLRDFVKRFAERLASVRPDSQPDDVRDLALLVIDDFTPIHPFHNGNGRMGRILANAILKKGGLPQIPVVIENKWKHRRALEESKVNPDAMKEYWLQNTTGNQTQNAIDK